MPLPSRIILATNNPHKVAEIRAILAGLDVEILDASSLTNPPDPEETGDTLEANAIIKARAFFAVSGVWALADDSGLEIDALDGQPGVVSARFAGPECSFADNNAKVLQLLDGIPPEERTARFRCVAALATGAETVDLFEGRAEGRITGSLLGFSGFGYDPVFYSPELGCTFAEATAEAKNRVSHRGRAFRAVVEHLKSLGED